jgi:hypothetical protein
MLDNMTKPSSDALVALPEDSIASITHPQARHASTKLGRRSRARRVKIVRPSALGMLLRPIGIAIALLLSAYALVSLGTTYYRSYNRHLDHTAAVHPDLSVFDIFFSNRSLPSDAVDLVIKDIDGSLRKVVASQSETDKFVNNTILMLDEERARIKQAVHEDLDQTFELAFQDREQAIGAYADWYFAWKRSYVVLKETITSAIARFIETGKYETVNEAIEADVKEYFLRNYKEQVLKPELRDQVIAAGVENTARHAHDSYRRVVANGDMRLQLFLAKHTSHLEDIPAATPVTQVKLDWDAQKWKAPVYLMEDRAFDGIAGIGSAAAGGTVGALALGPAINAVLARSFGHLSSRVAASLGTRVLLAQQGAVAGTLVQPMGGQVVGAAIGVALGAGVDYLVNETNEAFNRESFIAANESALDATIATWKVGLRSNLDMAIDRWFDDARAAIVLSTK